MFDSNQSDCLIRESTKACCTSGLESSRASPARATAPTTNAALTVNSKTSTRKFPVFSHASCLLAALIFASLSFSFWSFAFNNAS